PPMVLPIEGFYLAGRGQPKGPTARGGRLHHVERLFVRGEADAVGPLQGENRLADHRAVGLGVVDDAAVVVALTCLPEIGEPEAARAVEDEVVGPAQTLAVASVVERLELARLRIHALDTPARVVVGLQDGEELARAFH